MRLFSLMLFILISLGACRPVEEDVMIKGMMPQYASFDDFDHIQTEAPRPPVNLGKIVSVGDFLFINELFQGIHVVDNSDPANPEFIHFWAILGNTEFTIEQNTLYADNSRHLIVIDISDFANIMFVKFIEDFYNDEFVTAYRPPGYFGPFECVDPDIGIVIGWELETLTNPLCTAY